VTSGQFTHAVQDGFESRHWHILHERDFGSPKRVPAKLHATELLNSVVKLRNSRARYCGRQFLAPIYSVEILKSPVEYGQVGLGIGVNSSRKGKIFLNMSTICP